MFCFVEITQQEDTKKKKKKKKKSAAIATIDEGDRSNQGSTEELCHNTKDFPLSDASTFHPKQSQKTTKQGHSRSSSYPGKIKLETEISDENSGTSLPKSNAFGFGFGFGFGRQKNSREISLSDTSLAEESKSDVKWTDDSEENERIVKPHLAKSISFGQYVDTIEEKDEQQGEEPKDPGTSSSLDIHGNMVVMETDNKIGNLDKGSDIEYGSALLDYPDKKTKYHESVGVQDVSNNEKQKGLFSIRSFKQSKPRQNINTNKIEKRESLDESDLSSQDISSSSVSKDEDTLLVMGGDDGLMLLVEHRTHENSSKSSLMDKVEAQGSQDSAEDKEDRDSSKDSVSLSR
jgi:hypothetical protein